MSKPEYRYEKILEVPLKHLSDAVLVVSKMSGGKIPADKKQYYVNTHYRVEGVPEPAFTKGFSIQLEQIPSLCSALLAIYDRET